MNRTPNGTTAFYDFVEASSRAIETDVVLDFGAGRAEWFQAGSPIGAQTRDLRAPGRTVIGVDVDSTVLSNPSLDIGLVWDQRSPLPVDTASVDLVVSDWVFEHLEEPSHIVSELNRVLRPGGLVLVRTPSKWGYVGLGARLVPNALHARLAERLQPGRKSFDVFPTHYRANTVKQLEEIAMRFRMSLEVVFHNPDPTYSRSRIAHSMMRRWSSLPFEATGTVMHAKLSKPGRGH